jgi:hypothetical protein
MSYSSILSTTGIGDTILTTASAGTSIAETGSLGGILISAGKTGIATAGLVSDISKGNKLLSVKNTGQVASIISHSSNTGHGIASQLPTTSTQLHATNILGPLGAISALAADSITLGIRSGKAIQIKNELDKLPYDSEVYFKRQVLEARSDHAKGLVKSSVLGVTADSIAVTGSFVPVVGGIPATIVGVSVGILRIVAENNLDSDLQAKLEKITDDYRKSNPTIIQQHQAFRELHETLKEHHEKAKAKADEAGKAYLDKTKAYEKAVGTVAAEEAHRQLSESATTLVSSEHALEEMTTILEDYEKAKGNFDAYEEALLLMRDLEPKEVPQGERETRTTTTSRISTFGGGTEGLAFAPESEFSPEEETVDYVIKTPILSKTERALKEIGVTLSPKEPEKTTTTEKAPVQVSNNSDVEKEEEVTPEERIKFTQIMTTGVEGLSAI